MLFETFQKYKPLIITVAILIVVAIISTVVYRAFFSLHITSVTPDLNSVATTTPQITATFNKPIKEDSVTVEVENISTTTTVSESKVRINIFSLMASGEPYNITLSATSTDGYSVTEVLRFEPRINESLLSERDEEIILRRQQFNKPAEINDALFEYIPYSTLDYEIASIVDSSLPKPGIIIKVAISLSAVESRTDRAGSFERKKLLARQQLETFEKIDLSKYPVVYVLTGEGV